MMTQTSTDIRSQTDTSHAPQQNHSKHKEKKAQLVPLRGKCPIWACSPPSGMHDCAQSVIKPPGLVRKALLQEGQVRQRDLPLGFVLGAPLDRADAGRHVLDGAVLEQLQRGHARTHDLTAVHPRQKKHSARHRLPLPCGVAAASQVQGGLYLVQSLAVRAGRTSLLWPVQQCQRQTPSSKVMSKEQREHENSTDGPKLQLGSMLPAH